MSVQDGELIKLPGFPGGLNNVQPETSVPLSALREAVNVDLDDTGKVRRRAGYTLRLSGEWHSLFDDGDRLLGVRDGALVAVDANLTPTTLRSDVGAFEVSYAAIAGEVFWSNGREIRRVDHDDQDVAVWPDCPGQPVVSAYATGGLYAGTYQVAITYADAFGRESGSSLATLVALTEGQGILLSGIPNNPDATKCRVYVSQANGDVLFHAVDVVVGTSSYIIGAGRRGKPLSTQFLFPLPPGQILRGWNGRLFVASGTELWWSEPLRYGLTHPDNYIRFSGIRMFEPMGEGPQAGAFVSDAKRTYWMAGGDPKNWTMQIASNVSAVLGSSLLVPGSTLGLEYSGNVPYWLASDGVFCAGLPGGQVARFTEKRFVTPSNAERAASLLLSRDGISQLLTGVQGGMNNVATATDSAVATVRRNGITT